MSEINRRKSEEAIRIYNEQAEIQARQKEAEMFADAERYNIDLASGFRDEEKYWKLLDTGDGVMGYMEIPRINIRDPIYHSIEEEVLQKGIGHMQTSSLPVGGKATHAALSGHRGLPSSRLFTDLDRIREGDIILVRILTRTLAYEVYEIEVVEPESAGKLMIDPEDDLLTLITCTPYAVNSHRLLVRARRTEYKEEMAEIRAEHSVSESDRILFIALAIVATVLVVDVIVMTKRRKKRKKKKTKQVEKTKQEKDQSA